SDDRDYQPPVERYGDAYVDVALVDYLITPHRRIDDRPLLYSFDHRLDDERHEGELYSVAALVLDFQSISQLCGLGVVDLHERSHVRRDSPALHHPFGDSPAHHRHRLDLVAIAIHKRRRADLAFGH